MLHLLEEVQRCVQNGSLRFVLASQSPRRRDILQTNILGPNVKFESLASDFAEDWDKAKFVGKVNEYTMSYAREKADAVRQACDNTGKLTIFIGCDTVISQDGKILEKPSSESEAFEMLRSYRNRSHFVTSGVCLLAVDNRIPGDEKEYRDTFFCSTKVNFGGIPEEIIAAYVESKEPYDKAGGYGIQTLGACLAESIEGCYFNVVGLPASKVSSALGRLLSDHLGFANRAKEVEQAVNKCNLLI
jgi:septum formation protein